MSFGIVEQTFVGVCPLITDCFQIHYGHFASRRGTLSIYTRKLWKIYGTNQLLWLLIQYVGLRVASVAEILQP